MSNVFVLDAMYTPLDPVHPGYARKLLSSGKAAVYRRFPFTIVLKREIHKHVVQSLRLKLDPGSKTTGIAVVNDTSGEVVFAAELSHRGHTIKEALERRCTIRRSRRQRKTRYRKPRRDNRRRKQGWLPPSLRSRIANILTWVNRLCKYCPIAAISQELVRFDTQMICNPELSGIEYQQGTLCGYELREYLLEKWNRQCAYCDAKDVPLQVEHILARTNGGTDRVNNLCLACEPCNQKKGKQDIKVFLRHKPDVLTRILAHAKAPLKDASAVNSTRWVLFERLKATGLPVETGTGGMTKFHRTMQRLDKHHWIDAACVGRSTPDVLLVNQVKPLLIKAMGHGCRQMCLMSKYGFPCAKPKVRQKSYMGYVTGDMVKASIPRGKYKGIHEGRISIRFRPSFELNGFDVHPKYLKTVHRNDGYKYEKGLSHSSPSLKA